MVKTKRGRRGKAGTIFDTVLDTARAWFTKTKGEKHDSVESFDDQRKLHALFSHAAYSNKPKKYVAGHQRDKEFSDADTHFYRDPNSNRVIVGFRGTKISNNLKQSFGDLKSDVQISLNKKTTDRADRDYKKVAAFLAKNPNAQLSFSGHSLGAHTSAFVFSKLKKGKFAKNVKKQYLFNPGISTYGGLSLTKTPDGKRVWTRTLKNKDTHVSIVDGDPISKSIKGYKTVKNLAVISKKSGGTGIGNHGIKHFIDLKFGRNYMKRKK